MASRWLAMICACQTRAMDMKLMEITHNMRTSPTFDSFSCCALFPRAPCPLLWSGRRRSLPTSAKPSNGSNGSSSAVNRALSENSLNLSGARATREESCERRRPAPDGFRHNLESNLRRLYLQLVIQYLHRGFLMGELLLSHSFESSCWRPYRRSL